MKLRVFITIIAFVFGIVSCKNKGTSATNSNSTNVTTIKNDKNMNSFISIFEIPATDISRAINFYKDILGVDIERLDFPGMELGLFPYENQLIA